MLPKEQVGFRPNHCTLDQVALLTEDIKASFNKKLKGSVVFLDLSATCDTIWHRDLALKLLKTILSKEMVRAIKGIKSQPRFHVHIGKSKSRCRTLLNGVLQGSVDAPTLSNLFLIMFPQQYQESTYMQMALP